jgi:hypothetical protein
MYAEKNSYNPMRQIRRNSIMYVFIISLIKTLIEQIKR